MPRLPSRSTIVTTCLALGLVLTLAGASAACPTCKDSLAHDPAASNLARGVYYSILFMLTMPYLIFGSLCAYFYWEVCRARKRQAAEKSTQSSVEIAMQSQ